MFRFIKCLFTPNSDGDSPLGLAVCAVVFLLCMSALMHMPG